MKKIKAIVSGKVQGVGFRMYTRAQARQLGLYGYVRNLRNGDVEIVAAGEAERLDTLVEWAKSGAPSAVVSNLQLEVMNYSDGEFRDFEIRR
ncbi:acylphosphatase [Pleurocapsa sp. PCC 7319]|uniref:acylphosphatase n=1 Tax=Pleurocapsa sp. PCC 7319 TaxID=118161 RepID=UPI000345C34E|nr:acylphosphatase [Pleurocapsa sp. PCC 7319]